MSTSLENLDVLRAAESVADEIWDIVSTWGRFERDTLGKQLVRAVDSIGANIAEAYGRYHFGEKRRFLYFARGSLFETKYWLNRCNARRLIPDEQVQAYASQLAVIARQINAFARSIKNQQTEHAAKSVRENAAEYTIPLPDIFNDTDFHQLSNL